MIPVVGRRMNLLLVASSSSLSIAPLLPLPPPPMWIPTCRCVHCCFPCSRRLPSDYHRRSFSSSSSSSSNYSSTSTENLLIRLLNHQRSASFPHRHQGIGLESSCRLDSATCSFRGQFHLFLFFVFLISLSSVFLKTRINFIFHSRYSNPFCQREFQRLAQRPLTTLLSIPVLYLSVQCSTLNKNVSRLVLRVTSICLQLDRLNGSRWHIFQTVLLW